jgi:hypothetical protein
MIRRLAALASSPLVKGGLAVAVVGMGLKMLSDLVTELRGQVDDLNAEIAELSARRAEETVALLNAHHGRTKYPVPSDLDPLGRGHLVDDGEPEPTVDEQLAELA